MTRVAGELKSGKISVSSAAKECFDIMCGFGRKPGIQTEGTDNEGKWREGV